MTVTSTMPVPLFTKYALLHLALESDSSTVYAFECSATSAGLVSTGGEVVSLNTLCPDGSFSESAARAWQLSVTAVQDVESENSLQLFLIDHEGEKATATFYPKTDSAKAPQGRGWEGTVTIALPDTIGNGTIGQYATFTAVLPYEGKPQGIDAAGNPVPVAPTVTTVAPATGVAAGGLVTTVTGTGLTGATGVMFGGIAGTAFSVTNDTTVKATTPAHAAGTVDVVVQHPRGNVTKTGGFVYS